VRCWLSGSLLQLASIVLIALRGQIPDLFSIVLVNALLFAGQLTIFLGLKRFFGSNGIGLHNWIAFALYVSAAFWFTYVHPFLPARNINFALGSLFLGLQIVSFIAFGSGEGGRRLGSPLIAVYCVMALNDLWRIAVNAQIHQDIPYFQSGTENSLALLVNQFVLIAQIFALFFMVSGKLRKELVDELAERRRVEQDAVRNAEKFKQVFVSSPNTLILTRIEDGLVLDVNPAYEKMTGFTTEESIGKTTIDLNLWETEADRIAVIDTLGSGNAVCERELRFRKKDGSFLVGLFTATLMKISGTPCLLSTVQDITSRKADEERIKHLATHDHLTDLPSATLANEKLDLAIAIAGRNAASAAVLFIDLDGFKQVNDTLGHETGDALLVEIARRLKNCVREADVPARVGGDEFLVVLHEVGTHEDACAVAEKVLRAIREPLTIGGTELTVCASVGVACFPEHGRERGILVRAADAAMYRAKQSGKNRYCLSNGDAT